MTDRPRLLLADDHEIVTEGLRGLLESDYEIVGTATDGAALVKAARALKPDVVVVDISMPKLNGIDAVREIRRARPKTLAIVLTMHADRTYVAEALDAGAAGFVVKHAASDEIRTALLTVLCGNTYISPSVAGGVGRHVGGLTPRQRQVLQLVAEGYTVKKIARALALSPKTVEFHKYRIMRDLGVTTTAALIQYAVEHGLGGGKD